MALRESFGAIRIVSILGFGMVGVFCRYLLTLLFQYGFKTPTFWATMIANIVGATIIGFMQAYAVELKRVDDDLRYGVMVGLLGGFTTFSSYCLDSVTLFEKRDRTSVCIGLMYFLLSPLIGLGACWGAKDLTRALASD